jgi:hypothetical protein
MRNVSLKSMPVRYLHVVDPEKVVVTVEQFAIRRRWAAVALNERWYDNFRWLST